MTSFGDILNWAIPVLLIVVVAGFTYIKLIKPWVAPSLAEFWGWMKEKMDNNSGNKRGPREINFD